MVSGLARPALRIGLTGGIGSGKSTVATLLAACGASIVDTDAIARQISLPGGAAIDTIREAFGPEFIDATGGLDRARMRTLAFSDDAARRRLEAILHPLIGIETERQARSSSAPIVVFDVPLLVESGRWRARVHKVLVVDCAEATQVTRVVARSGWTADAVQAVIDRQASRTQRRACADAVIFNEALSHAELGVEVRSLWHAWTHPATGRSQLT
jgi:dephospho-CoA kinase